MRIGARVRKLAEARWLNCRPVELRVEGESEPVTERDRCPGCGGCHVIVVREEVVDCYPVSTSSDCVSNRTSQDAH